MSNLKSIINAENVEFLGFVDIYPEKDNGVELKINDFPVIVLKSEYYLGLELRELDLDPAVLDKLIKNLDAFSDDRYRFGYFDATYDG